MWSSSALCTLLLRVTEDGAVWLVWYEVRFGLLVARGGGSRWHAKGGRWEVYIVNLLWNVQIATIVKIILFLLLEYDYIYASAHLSVMEVFLITAASQLESLA